MNKNKEKIIDNLDCFAEEFRDVDLESKKIKQAEFEECSFISCNFSETVFHSCRFIDCHFENCNMGVMKLTDTIVSGTEFVACKMIAIDWTMCDWQSLLSSNPLKFVNCILNDSNFFGLNLEGLQILECSTKNVDFACASFVRANFSSTDFKGALFSETNLEYTNFTNATNTQIDLQTNKLKGAIFNRNEALYLLERTGIVLVD